MWLFNQASAAARAALVYITAGALIDIWTGVWYVYLHNNPPETTIVYYWCAGLLLTGLVLMLIGFGLGRIGRAARHADTPAALISPVDAQPVRETPVVPVASPTRTFNTINGDGGRVLVPGPRDGNPTVASRNLP